MKLTEHFTLEELMVTQHRWFDNTPNDEEKTNLMRLAEFLERVKSALDMRPIMINSAFRSKAVNDAVGSKDTSQHRLGCAADFRVPGMTPDAVCRVLIASGLPYDQIIREFSDPINGGGWIHISIPNTINTAPRKQALIIDRFGTRQFV